VTSALLGNWSGTLLAADQTYEVTIAMTVSQSASGDLFGRVNLKALNGFDGSAQLTYNATTGRLKFYVISPRLVIKFAGSLTAANSAPWFIGALESYTSGGVYRGSFALHPSLRPVAPV
jgi:hypothetical protein